ncbi:virus Gp157, partial [Peptostreptococcus russellii]
IELDKKKIETSIGKLAIRTSKAVEISADINTLPDEYKRIKTIVEANRTELKKALKQGIEIDGVELVENYNLNIR